VFGPPTFVGVEFPRTADIPRLENRETWGTLYNRVGVVKRHVFCSKGFQVLIFPSWEFLILVLLLSFAH
jgi:hypothetical protein